MIKLTRRGAILILFGLLSCASTTLRAQVTFQGLMEGIYPTRLVIDETTPKASLSISTLSNKIEFIGGCNGGVCKYRAIDTALTLVFERKEDNISGRLQLGDGRGKSFTAARIDAETVFPNNCNETFWVRAWSDAASKHQLSLATLPGNQLKGTFYVAALGTSFSVSGTNDNNILSLTLQNATGKTVGNVQANLPDQAAGMSANLDLDGTQSTIELALDHDVKLNCLQVAGRFDMVHPNLANTANAALPIQLWKQLVSRSTPFGHVWFEPTRFDQNVLSGWLHSSGPEEQESQAITMLRNEKVKLRQGGLLGGKRTKTQLISLSKQRAVDQHPLHADEDFKTWAAELHFSDFTLTPEGLAFASARHPMYGQLQMTVPWRELPKTESLPAWLTQTK